MKEFKIDDKILKVRLPNAVEALLLWGKIKKAIVEAEESSIHEAYSARCIEQLKNFADLTEFGITFDESLNDIKFFQAYHEAAEEFVSRMMVFFKKKD